MLLIFIGIQFISLGLIAELQARTYHESQDKPVYHVKNIFRSGEEEPIDRLTDDRQ